MAQEPDLLLLDEPTQGLSPEDTAATVDVIRRIARERGLTILLVEHDMDVVFGLADRVTVLHFGSSSPRARRRDARERRGAEGVSRRRDERRRHASCVVDGLQTFYGKSHVLHGVSSRCPRRDHRAPRAQRRGQDDDPAVDHGATPPRGGTVSFPAAAITGRPPHASSRLGIGYVPEGRQIFPYLDVGENLRLA